jgi:hypothetical protein
VLLFGKPDGFGKQERQENSRMFSGFGFGRSEQELESIDHISRIDDNSLVLSTEKKFLQLANTNKADDFEKNGRWLQARINSAQLNEVI